MAHPQSHFQGKVVLVTGAGGSIGSEICRKLLEYGVRELRMVGHSEAPLYDTEKNLRASLRPIPAPELRVTLASVTDGKAMAAACEGVDIVIHAAAHKHVPLCEQNPLEAITNNVGGTIELAHAASRAGVSQFVMVSTDKAVKPSSVMGATKRACELFIQFLATRTSMKCTIVRFGNVLNSSGSVLPLWREQIKAGKPITLTDKRCTRYFMSIQDAVELTLGAASLPRGGLFVLDMGKPRSMHELAQETLAENRLYFRGAPLIFDNEIVETGLRPGEKLEEELSYGGEQVKTSIPKVFALREEGGRHILRWEDFTDLLMAAKFRHKPLALEQLWNIVR
jgi:FlaA1/EpsC-like NDP-sugar epimerase